MRRILAALAVLAAVMTGAALVFGSGQATGTGGETAAAAAGPDRAAVSEQLREGLRQAPRNVQEVWQSMIDRVLAHLPGVVAGLVLLLLFWGLARLTGRVLRRLLVRAQADPSLVQIGVPLVRIAIVLLGVLAAIEQMGINVASLLAGVGIAGLAIGLAAQETLANVFAGLMLLWDRPFRLGHVVSIGPTVGTVTDIGMRSVRLRTLEGLEVTIPNKQVAQVPILNHTRYPAIRINVPVTVGYGENLDRVRDALLAAARSRSEVLAEPAPQVVVTSLADPGVTVELRAWVATPVAESVNQFALFELVKKALDEAGIAIPFPQRLLLVRPGAVPAEPALTAPDPE